MLICPATREGFHSVEEMRSEHERKRAMHTANEKAQQASRTWKTDDAGLSAEDAKVAAEIRARVEAEAKRKAETGDFTSGPGGVKVRRQGHE